MDIERNHFEGYLKLYNIPIMIGSLAQYILILDGNIELKSIYHVYPDTLPLSYNFN